jgi:hypothetical protein
MCTDSIPYQVSIPQWRQLTTRLGLNYPQPKIQILYNFNFKPKIARKISGLYGSSPTKWADFSYQTGGSVPTKRAASHNGRVIRGLLACVSYQTGEHGQLPLDVSYQTGERSPTPTCIPLGVGGSGHLHEKARQSVRGAEDKLARLS